MLKVCTVFSGIGSLEFALKELNIEHEIIFACDNDKFVKESYYGNYNPLKWYDDIKNINGKNYLYEDIDLFVGGSPCQSFSVAGKKLGLDDERGLLIWEFTRLVDEIKPNVFIFENVKSLLNKNNRYIFDLFCKKVIKSGYKIYYQVLNGKDYNIPQNRERVFIVGFLDHNKQFEFPIKQTLLTRVSDLLEDDVEDKYYISNDAIKGHFVRKLKHLENNNTGFGFKSFTRKSDYIRTLMSRYYKDGSDNLFSSIPITIEDIKQLNYEKFYGKIRKMTPRECLRFMGFSDEFKIIVSDSQMYKQVGNSIIVNVLKEVLKGIYG